MRHETSLSPDYFKRLFTKDADPWNFEKSDYEAAKYDHTLECLPKPRFRRALEIGCANGALTARLAERCDSLIAVDVVDEALERARARCAKLPHVSIRKAQVPHDPLPGMFDLILLSEVAYYWDSDDLVDAAHDLTIATEPGGHLLLVHWTGETDYPKSGDDAVTELQKLTGNSFAVVSRERRPEYRLDLWTRVSSGR